MYHIFSIFGCADFKVPLQRQKSSLSVLLIPALTAPQVLPRVCFGNFAGVIPYFPLYANI